MTITFNGVQGAGYEYVNVGTTGNDNNAPEMPTPTDAASGTLVLGLWGAEWPVAAGTLVPPSIPVHHDR